MKAQTCKQCPKSAQYCYGSSIFLNRGRYAIKQTFYLFVKITGEKIQPLIQFIVAMILVRVACNF